MSIEVAKVSRFFGRHPAVQNLDMSVPSGTVTGLVGPNGAGKTTLLLMLAALLAPDSGTIRVAGLDPVAQPTQVHQAVGWMPDAFGTWDSLTCNEILLAFAAAQGMEPTAAQEQAIRMLATVHLSELERRPTRVLSRGQKQRLGLARALVHQPQVLLLDEPASGMDPRSRADLRVLLRDLAAAGTTVLISSHILSELEEMVDGVIFMERGHAVPQQASASAGEPQPSTGQAAGSPGEAGAPHPAPAPPPVHPTPVRRTWRMRALDGERLAAWAREAGLTVAACGPQGGAAGGTRRRCGCPDPAQRRGGGHRRRLLRPCRRDPGGGLSGDGGGAPMRWKGMRTVMVLELRQRVRATRWRIMLLLWLLVLVLVCGGLSALAAIEGAEPGDTVPPLYDLIVSFVLGIGLIVAPTLASTSINGDRADATLALLQATALRPVDIALGKLFAAWAAALAFLGVALPFLLALVMVGGATPLAFAGHLLVVLVTLASVCAIGLGFSGLTARTSASTVLTYLAVAALVIGTPLATAIASSAVHDQQKVTSHSREYLPQEPGSQDETYTSYCRTSVYYRDIVRTERIWWLLAPNPFVILSDVSVRSPHRGTDDTDHWSSPSILEEGGEGVDSMRTPEPARITEDFCSEDDSGDDTSTSGAMEGAEDERLKHLAFWPAGLLFLALLGGGGTLTAVRRLAVPAGALPRGIRLA